MKKNFVRNGLVITLASVMGIAVMAGCGSKDAASDTVIAEEETAAASETESAEEETEAVSEDVTTDEETAADNTDATDMTGSYFTKGVYVNYADGLENPDKDYFYVINGDTYGYTADGSHGGIGVPFSFEQSEGSVEFSFGGEDEESRDTLIITSNDNGVIYGYFEDAPMNKLVFEPVEGVDPENFSAENYVNGPENSVYEDATGWTIKYNANDFAVTPENGQVFIVYQGEAAGSNVITVTYTVDNNAEGAIKEIGSAYGDKATYTEGTFPGTEDVKGYWVSVDPDTEGSGAFMTAIARDYMEGALIFETDGHMGNDEEMNMAVSDALAGIIDSLEFPFEN